MNPMVRPPLFRTDAVHRMRDINALMRVWVTKWTQPTIWDVDTDPNELLQLAAGLENVAAHVLELANDARAEAEVMPKN